MTNKRNKTPQKGKNKPVKNPSPISTQILIKPIHRGINDIATWRSAIRLADMGNRCKLYDLYTDLLIDGYLSDAIEKRIDAVTDCDLSFTINGKPVDAITELMDTPEFEELLKEIMHSRFWGVSVIECSFIKGFVFTSILRKHIRTKTKEIAIREEDEHGTSYADNDRVIQFGQDDDFGIILKAAPYVIYKRGGFGDWAQFVEIFGMPQRVGKYSSMDESSRRALIRAFEEAGSAPYLVIPEETKVENTVMPSGTNGALYNDFRKACNEEILITILGQTMTTQDGSSLAQGKVHLAVQEKKHRADRRYVQRMLNKYVVPLLDKQGYPVKGGKFKFLDKAQELNVTDTVQLSDILPIPQEYLYDKYNIPQPKEGESIAQRQIQPSPFDVPEMKEEEEGQEEKKGKKPEKLDKQVEAKPANIKNRDRNFFLQLWDFFVKAPAKTDRGILTGTIRMSDEDGFNAKLIKRVAEREGEASFDAELFQFFSEDFLKAVRTPFKQVLGLADRDYTYGAPDDAFVTSMEMNLFHFSAAKTLAEIQELNCVFRESESYDEFREQAENITKTFNETWQKTEYETAVLTAESASNYQRLSKKTKLFPYWKYNTAGDDRVRPEHAELDGLVLPASDPRWDKIFPPNGWKCRCYITPLMEQEVTEINFEEMQSRCDAYFQTTDWKKNEEQHWDINPGKTKEVFGRDQMYIRKFPGKAAKELKNLFYNDYGLDSFTKKLGMAKDELPLFKGDVSEWYKAHTLVEDYKGRKVVFPPKVFRRHTTGKYEKMRIELLDSIPDVLRHPDEVWINDYVKENDFRNIHFIKFYKGRAIDVVCDITEAKKYEISTWFEIEQEAKRKDKSKGSRGIATQWRYRRGLLIKK